MKDNIEKLIIRQSGNFFTETLIQNQYYNRPEMGGEFMSRNFTGNIEQRDYHNSTQLIIKKDSGAGLHFEITSHRRLRQTTLVYELGLDDLNILEQYIASVKAHMRNYHGDLVVKNN
jgi:hypothetical protein